ncbi:uncharacterized protein B0H18DRAFT_1034170 [Fomitopsis serialis]|uniref:uncharacterized protein n=1 Tax=Fomitopsis serialis TaxID=139415 RepID=UPI002008E6F0|nr:uncharacterized protein B0H18DRAFT_1034170 [Neoantrodia serialis]KAH9917551.1 hypothetical protein B0H18DRAFT_1034170 [Neoantrodia serialis]
MQTQPSSNQWKAAAPKHGGTGRGRRERLCAGCLPDYVVEGCLRDVGLLYVICSVA